MKVYVVLSGDYDDGGTVEAVYLDENKAEKHSEEFNEKAKREKYNTRRSDVYEKEVTE